MDSENVKNFNFKETRSCLRQTSENSWELTEPHLLYLDQEQSDGYLEVMQDRNYSKGFHSDTVELIEAHLHELFQDQSDVSLIDLGPGYPDKSLPMARFQKNRGQRVFYYPVDVSGGYLKISEREMRPYCEDIVPVLGLFQDAQAQIPQEAYSRKTLAMIGLTFMNFNSRDILNLLKIIAGPKGRVIFASEMISDANPACRIISAYQGEIMKGFTFGPLRCLGFDEGQITFRVVFEKQRVECQFVVLQERPDLPIKENDIVTTAVSYRYTGDELEAIVRDNFSHYRIWRHPNGRTALVEGEC